MENKQLKINDIIPLEIKRMGINGEGIGYYNRLAIFVDNALPKEEVLVLISEVYENRAVGKIIKIIKKSDNRTTPFCPVFDDCGGCQTQHYDYDTMLKQKKDIIIKSLDRYLKKYDYKAIKETIGMDNPLHYRNKASLPLKKIGGVNRFGMFARNSHEFIPIKECAIQHQLVNTILNSIVNLMDKLAIDAYDNQMKTGVISSVVIRVALSTNQAQVTFIIKNDDPKIEELTEILTIKHPQIISVFKVIPDDINALSFTTNNSQLIYGEPTISEILDGYKFELSQDTFFQLNASQATKFYKKIESIVANFNNDIALDIYAGIAPISHFISNTAKKIYALDLNCQDDNDTKQTLIDNKIDNVEVLNLSINQFINQYNNLAIDVMLFDTAKIGLTPQAHRLIKLLLPQRIIYASCNPSTLAKDLSELTNHYEIIEITPFDMFPYTSMVESVTLLELKETN